MKTDVTTTSSLAIEIPAKRRGLIVQNRSDTDIKIAFEKAANTDSIVLPATSGSFTLFDEQALSKGLAIHAIHEGAGTKQLTYDIF